ncbi:DUF2653 family protein [Caryophanon tenue]|uniref:DUF2653 domain-containing protein n=1 Tax=Caryophanon tenue TaxID=33978 RepID=A0A1C0YM90_9BACL|nr:DUF2653 family protein [Caryophanon tenue]OCS88297.1 hypothetical protein A6M13_00185 [Caryophanon tenue]
MEQITLLEQDLVNAVCRFHARYKNVEPSAVTVELTYDDAAGYGAEADVAGHIEYFNTGTFIAAIRLYINDVLQKNAASAGIELAIDDVEGMVAYLRF